MNAQRRCSTSNFFYKDLSYEWKQNNPSSQVSLERDFTNNLLSERAGNFYQSEFSLSKR